MRIAHAPSQLDRRPRAVAIGTFDGMHLGHRSVIARRSRDRARADRRHVRPAPAAGARQPGRAAGDARAPARAARRGGRRGDAVVVEFTPELMRLEPEEFAPSTSSAIGAEAVVAGEDFRFGHRRAGDLELLDAARLPTCVAPWSTASRPPRSAPPLHEGDLAAAASDARPPARARRCRRRGRPARRHARLPDRQSSRRPGPARAAVRDLRRLERSSHRAAISIGTNPHYGGDERRIEAFLLDFAGDLYGRRLVVELWERLRDEARLRERAGAGRPDRRATSRRREPPSGPSEHVLEPDRVVARHSADRRSASPRVAGRPGPCRRADAAEVVVELRPAAHRCGRVPRAPRARPRPRRARRSRPRRPGGGAAASTAATGSSPSSRIPASDADERRAEARPAGRAEREHEAVARRARRSAPSCSPSARRRRAARGRGRPRRACCSGAGRARAGSRRSRGRGSSSGRRRSRRRRRRPGSSCGPPGPARPRARRGSARTRSVSVRPRSCGSLSSRLGDPREPGRGCTPRSRQ